MRSAYTGCKCTVRSAKNAGPWLQPHVRESALAQSQTHATEGPTCCGDKGFRVFLNMAHQSSGIVRAGPAFCPPRGTRALRGRSDRRCQRGSVQGEEQRSGEESFFKNIPWQVPLTFQNTEDHGPLLVQRHLGLAASPGLSCPLHSKCLCSASASLLGGGLSWDWGKKGNFLLNSMPLGSHIY